MYEDYLDMVEHSVEPYTEEEYEQNKIDIAERYEEEFVSLQQNEQLNTENNGEEILQPTDARIQGGTEVLSGEQVHDTGRSEGSLGDGQGVSTSEYGEGSGDLQKEEGTGTGVSVAQSEQLKPTDLRDGVKPDTAELGADEAKAKAKGLFECAIRHTFKQHGSEQELNRGQIPITDEDFERIPDVVENYDDVNVEAGKRGEDNIVYSKSYPDGKTIFVE